MPQNKADSNVKTALRVVEIIEIFAREARPLPLSELARHLDAPVSSCLALLRTLERLGYLYQAGRRQGYYPTGRLLSMSLRIAEADPILGKVMPVLVELRDTTQESVVLAKLDRLSHQVVYLDVLGSTHSIRYVAEAGAHRDIHANSLGKALLSTLQDKERRALLGKRKLKAYNARTLVTVETIEADIHASLQRGWFANLGESMTDVGAIAWPLKISGNYYAISIAGPLYRIQNDVEDHAAKLRAACRFIEDGL